MSNTTLLRSSKDCTVKNSAGGKAYKLSEQNALLQYAMTGTLNDTFYVTSKSHLETVLNLCKSVPDDVVAKAAIISRKYGYMKDMPAMLLAYLNAINPKLLSKIFHQVVDNGTILKNFVQIVRSGVTGRRGFGDTTKNTIRRWFDDRDDTRLLYDSIGNDGVSLDNIIRMIRPKPIDKQRSAMYAWLCGAKIIGDQLVREVRYPEDRNAETVVFKNSSHIHNVADLPQRIRELEHYLANPQNIDNPPKVPFRLLTRLKLSKAAWEKIAKDMSWQELRQNLDTLTRHGVFESPAMIEYACKKLRDSAEIAKSKVFPYQLLSAYLNTGPTPSSTGVTQFFWNNVAYYQNKKASESAKIPMELRYALQDAMEVAVENIPVLDGKAYLCVDVSGSMGYPVTGEREASKVSTKIRCLDVAGLMAAIFLRRNPMATVLPFNTKILDIKLNPMDRIMSNAEKFVKYGQGGTACSEPLRVLNEEKALGNTIVFLSDNESWADKTTEKGTAFMKEWKAFKDRNPEAKLICIDITPKVNAQLEQSQDVLLIGGFSDHVFNMVDQFINNKFSVSYWQQLLDKIEL